MLPRNNRLSLKNEMARIKRNGRIINGPFFGILITKGEAKNRQPPRFSFIISNKIDKKAVVRHRIKRMLVESVRPFLPKVKTGAEAVFLVRPGIKDKTLEEIKKEVEKMIKAI